ncbi:unnamed protein product [Choristocarpus tenellus]
MSDPLTELVGQREAKSPDGNPLGTLVTRETDIILVTAPKTGTTWLQQILHQLRMPSPPHMDFDDIIQVVPWPHLTQQIGLDTNAEQLGEPRCFKSHQRLAAVWRGARYIAVVRDPVSVIESWWAFNSEKKHPSTLTGTIDDFVEHPIVMEEMLFGANIWDYYNEFWICRNVPQILFLVFEDMVKDLRGTLPKIAAFMGLVRDDAFLDTVAEASSKQFMMAHSEKFDESWLSAQMQKHGKIFYNGSLVNNKKNDRLSQESRDFLDQVWMEKIGAETGLNTYKEFANCFREGAALSASTTSSDIKK